MLSFPNYEIQLQLIHRLKNQMDNAYVTLDDLMEIKKYLPKTSLNLGFVLDCLNQAVQKSRSTFGLKQKIQQIKLDFIEHLDKRIYFLTHLREASSKHSNPWLASLKQDASINEDLIKAHLHVEDILFTSQEIFRYFPEQMESFIEKEFIPFQAQHLCNYMQILTHLSKESKENISQTFSSLQKSLLNKDLNPALLQIEKTLAIWAFFEC